MRDISSSAAKLAVSLHTITEKNEPLARLDTHETRDENEIISQPETPDKNEGQVVENNDAPKLPRPPSVPNNIGSNASLSRRTSALKSPSRKSLGSASKITSSPSKLSLKEEQTTPTGSKTSSRGNSAGKRPETSASNSAPKLNRRASTATLQSVTGDIDNLGPVQDNDFGRVKVYVRVRPMTEQEENNKEPDVLSFDDDLKQVTVSESNKKEQAFAFDHVFPSTSQNKDIFTTVAKPIVTAAMHGFNGTLMSYGQTGSGKTHTLMSPDGLMARTIHFLFKQIHQDIHHNYKVTCSYIQVYQERIYDLLGDIRPGSLSPTKLSQSDVAQYELALRESPEKGVWVEGLSEFVVERPKDMFELLQTGKSRLVFGETKMNRASSRSHAICFLTVERSSKNSDEVRRLSEAREATETGFATENEEEDNFEFKGEDETPILNNSEQETGLDVETGRDIMLRGRIAICDLAGSERIKKTHASGDRLSEAQHINLSLLELGNVIHALTDPKRSHVPFRNAVLTRLLQESLGGNCKTSLIVCVSPSQRDAQETRGTLAFGYRAMRVKNCARVNVEVDYKALADALAAQIGDKEKEWREREAKVQADLEALREQFGAVNNERETLLARLQQLENELKQNQIGGQQKEAMEQVQLKLKELQELSEQRMKQQQDENVKYLAELIRWEATCQELKKAIHDDADVSEQNLLASLKPLNETIETTTDLQKWFNVTNSNFMTKLTNAVTTNQTSLMNSSGLILEWIQKLNLSLDDCTNETDANTNDVTTLQLLSNAYQYVMLQQALLFIEMSQPQQPPPLPPKEESIISTSDGDKVVQIQAAQSKPEQEKLAEPIPGAINENEEKSGVPKLQTRPPTVVGDVDDHIEREAAKRAQTCRVGRLACTFM